MNASQQHSLPSPTPAANTTAAHQWFAISPWSGWYPRNARTVSAHFPYSDSTARNCKAAQSEKSRPSDSSILRILSHSAERRPSSHSLQRRRTVFPTHLTWPLPRRWRLEQALEGVTSQPSLGRHKKASTSSASQAHVGILE